jgi:hypothetical protein
MSDEKRKILEKINDLIDKRKKLLIQQLLLIREVGDNNIVYSENLPLS